MRGRIIALFSLLTTGCTEISAKDLAIAGSVLGIMAIIFTGYIYAISRWGNKSDD
ncbi:MAG: hypothetical protein PHW53_00590 [Patescibacteria group bacterium]|nr:hypothetical protein [Patescibacteria group bacterium]